jgi:hypothetical protein
MSKTKKNKHRLILTGQGILCGDCKRPCFPHLHDEYVQCKNEHCEQHQIKYELPVVKTKEI